MEIIHSEKQRSHQWEQFCWNHSSSEILLITGTPILHFLYFFGERMKRMNFKFAGTKRFESSDLEKRFLASSPNLAFEKTKLESHGPQKEGSTSFDKHSKRRWRKYLPENNLVGVRPIIVRSVKEGDSLLDGMLNDIHCIVAGDDVTTVINACEAHTS